MPDDGATLVLEILFGVEIFIYAERISMSSQVSRNETPFDVIISPDAYKYYAQFLPATDTFFCSHLSEGKTGMVVVVDKKLILESQSQSCSP